MQNNINERLAAEVAPPLSRSGRNNRIRSVRWGLTILAGSVALAIFACTSDTAQGPTTPDLAVSFDGTGPKLTSDQQHRLDAAKARAGWAGEAHHAGMQVIVESVRQHRRGKRPLPRAGSAEHCALLERAGGATLAVLDINRGITRSQAERIAHLRRDPILANCSRSLSVFALRSPSVFPAPVAQEYDPEVTGAYEAYLDPMDVAVQGSDGSVRSVRTRVDAVLAQAISDGIPEGDLLALASFAGVAESSAVEWNAFDWAALGADSCVSGDECLQMSVFGARRADNRVLKIVGIDALGCLSTVKGWGALKALLIGPAWAALAGECGLRAAFASGGALVAML